MEIIKDNYSELNIQRSDLAKKMAISERQLQRKLKSLIDQNPMDLLRNYRLEQSKRFLSEGDQVGVAADKSGFISMSNFSKSFKATFGLTPKQYQQSL